MQIICPHCRGSVNIVAQHQGMFIQCPHAHCSGGFTVPHLQTGPPKPTPPPVAPPLAPQATPVVQHAAAQPALSGRSAGGRRSAGGSTTVRIDTTKSPPKICAACGVRCSGTTTLTFDEPADGSDLMAQLFFGGLIASLMRRRRQVRLPLCSQHQSYRLWQALELSAWIAGILIALVAGVAMLAALANTAPPAALLVVLATWAVVMIALIVGLIVRGLGWVRISLTRATSRSVTLIGVSPEFARACRESHSGESENFLRNLAGH